MLSFSPKNSTFQTVLKICLIIVLVPSLINLHCYKLRDSWYVSTFLPKPENLLLTPCKTIHQENICLPFNVVLSPKCNCSLHNYANQHSSKTDKPTAKHTPLLLLLILHFRSNVERVTVGSTEATISVPIKSEQSKDLNPLAPSPRREKKARDRKARTWDRREQRIYCRPQRLTITFV